MGCDYASELKSLTSLFLVPQMIGFMCMESDSGMILTEKTEEHVENPVQGHFVRHTSYMH
jgi:hypothetical protein